MNGATAGFVELTGQREAAQRLTQAVESPVPAYLFVGPSGAGKREAARIFAGEIFASRASDENDAARHRRLARDEQHPDLVVIERDGATINIGTAREVVRVASLSPADAALKVILLVDFHLVGDRAPVVLKAIEEPPPSTMFVVLVTDVPPELVTIASRCVRIDFAPVPDSAVIDRLVSEGIDLPMAASAAAAASGDLGRARLLATDPELEARISTWRSIPKRLDGSGHVVGSITDELMGMVESAAEPLRARHESDLVSLEERVALTGERGSGRKDLIDLHKRELRRHRADELRSGLAALVGSYRDLFVGDAGVSGDDVSNAGLLVQRAIESLPQNPNERLMLQALLVQLPARD